MYGYKVFYIVSYGLVTISIAVKNTLAITVILYQRATFSKNSVVNRYCI
jgi:hypothetical protein